MTSIDWKTWDFGDFIIIYIYVLLKNNVVFNKKVNENSRKAARAM
jgi:hypothetical protein